MEPVGQWPAPYDRQVSSARDTLSTAPPLLPPPAYNSVLFNQQSMYQLNSPFSTNSGQYHHSTASSLTASNPYYETPANPVLMSLPGAESISPQMGPQSQSSYRQTGSESVTRSFTVSTTNSSSYENCNNHLFGTAAHNSINFNFSDKNSTLQPCGVLMNIPKDNFYPTISHQYQVPTSPVNNNFYNSNETSKKPVIVTPATVSPSSFPSPPISSPSTTLSLPASVKVNAQYYSHHQQDLTMTLNSINSEKFLPTISTTRSPQTFDNNSTFSQPINITSSKEMQSSKLAPNSQHMPSVSHSQLQSNSLYDHSSKTPLNQTSYQYTINKNLHHVYSNQILGNCSSPSPPLPVSIRGSPTPSTHLSSNKLPPSDLTASRQRSGFQAAFDQRTSGSMSPGYQVPLSKGAEYASSLQQGFQKRPENIGCYSPCSRQEQSPVACAVTSPTSPQFQTSPHPSYPSHNSPVTFSPTLPPSYKSPNILDSSVFQGELSPRTKDPATNVKQVTHLNQHYHWKDSNHNLQKMDSNYPNNIPSSVSPSSGNAFERNSGTENSYLYPMLNGKISTPNSDPISSMTNVMNIIKTNTNVLPKGIINSPESQNQINSKQTQPDLQSKDLMEQKLSNNGSNPFVRSSTIHNMKSYDVGNQIGFNNPSTGFKNPTFESAASIASNASSQNRNQTPQETSQQFHGDSSSFYNSPSLNGNNTMNRIDISNALQNTVSHSPSRIHSTPEQQRNNSLFVSKNGATQLAKEILSNTSSKPKVENSATNSMNLNYSDGRVEFLSKEVIKTNAYENHSTSKQQRNSSLFAPYNDTTHVAKRILSNTSTKPNVESYAKNSINANSSDGRVKFLSKEIIKINSYENHSTPKQQHNSSLFAPYNNATHVAKQIRGNTSTKPKVENYAKNSMSANSSDGRVKFPSKEIIKTIPSEKVNQSLMVSKSLSPNATPNVPQTHSLNVSQSRPSKCLSISIQTENSSSCRLTSIAKEDGKAGVVVPVPPQPTRQPLEQAKPPVNQQTPTRKGRPPKTKNTPIEKMPEKKPLSFPPSINNGFMASYIKFLEGIQYDSPDEVVPPKKEVTTKRPKRKSSTKSKIIDDEYENGEESINSDSDPAWSPANKDDSDDEFDIGRKTRTRPVRGSTQRGGRKRGRWSTMSEVSSDDDDDSRASKQKKYATRTKSVSQSEGKSNDSDVITNLTETKNVPEAFPFQVGEFVINKSEVNLENPPIWRVDGKTLLQKYETSEQKGEIVYKNIPTYAGWTHLNSDSFEKVEVEIIYQTRTERVVRLLAQETKVSDEEQKAIDKHMLDTMKYQDNFEIYIQTLISQALDSNFLGEIIRENDDYFLDSVKAIDGIATERRKKLIDFASWQDSVVEKSMATWPCIDVLQGSPKTGMSKEKCDSCKVKSATKRVIAFGQPYNNENLEGCPPDPAVSEHKDFVLCMKCKEVVSLYNKIVHQKYQMFNKCASKVQDKRTSDPTKDTTIILNELLADEQWLSQLFKDVRTNWALVEKYAMKNENVEVKQ